MDQTRDSSLIDLQIYKMDPDRVELLTTFVRQEIETVLRRCPSVDPKEQKETLIRLRIEMTELVNNEINEEAFKIIYQPLVANLAYLGQSRSQQTSTHQLRGIGQISQQLPIQDDMTSKHSVKIQQSSSVREIREEEIEEQNELSPSKVPPESHKPFLPQSAISLQNQRKKSKPSSRQQNVSLTRQSSSPGIGMSLPKPQAEIRSQIKDHESKFNEVVKKFQMMKQNFKRRQHKEPGSEVA